MSVVPAEPNVLVSLAQFKTFIKVTSDTQDDLLQEALDAATDIVAEGVDASLTSSTLRLRVRPGARALVLPFTHLQNVQMIIRPDLTALALEEADVDLVAGIITVPRALAGEWQVDVTPRGGMAALSLAVKIIAKHLWGTQRGTQSGGPRGEIDAQQGEVVLVGYAIPRRAAELLKPYLAPGFA